MTLDNVTWVADIAELAPHYGTTSEASMLKVAPHMTAEYRAWIMASRLCVLTTVGP